jgi:hypothetical protein
LRRTSKAGGLFMIKIKVEGSKKQVWRGKGVCFKILQAGVR